MTPSTNSEISDAALVDQLRRLVDDQEGGDAVVLVQRQLFNRVVGRLAARRAANTPVSDDETYEIGKRDGYEEAVQHIDERTGGDGEYRYCTDHDPDRHTPDAPAMIERIVARFDALSSSPALPSQVVGDVERFEPFADQDDLEFKGMGAVPDGEWVRYSDYVALSSLHPTEGAAPVAWRCFDRIMEQWSVIDSAELAASRQRRSNDWIVIPLYTRSSPVSAEVTDYLVWSNEHRAWWRHKSQGYARNILEAGRYTRAEAVDIADKSRNGWELDRRPDEIAVAIADLPPPIRAALASLNGGRENG